MHLNPGSFPAKELLRQRKMSAQDYRQICRPTFQFRPVVSGAFTMELNI